MQIWQVHYLLWKKLSDTGFVNSLGEISFNWPTAKLRCSFFPYTRRYEHLTGKLLFILQSFHPCLSLNITSLEISVKARLYMLQVLQTVTDVYSEKSKSYKQCNLLIIKILKTVQWHMVLKMLQCYFFLLNTNMKITPKQLQLKPAV